MPESSIDFYIVQLVYLLYWQKAFVFKRGIMRFIIVLFLAVIPSISAQVDTTAKRPASDTQFFLSIGIGPGTYGVHLGYALQYITNSHAFSARYIDCGRLSFIQDGCPSSNATEFAVLYGYSELFRYKYFMPNIIQAHAGISVLKERTITPLNSQSNDVGFCNYSEEIKYPFGIAYNIEVIQTILPVLGIGFNIYGSLNTSKSINGVKVRLYLGKMYNF